MTREEKIALRLAAIYNDPLVFLKYCCFTNDAADPAAPPTSPFPIHLPYVRQLVVDYQQEPMIVIEKARQLCVSWTFAGLFSWEILTKPNVLGLIFSQDQDKTIEFGRRVKFILDNIPDRLWPRNTRGTHLVTQEHCTIPEMNSKLLFLTSSPDKGHGYTPTFTLFDEFGYHPAAEESYRAIIGGAVKKTSRLYVVSTPPPIVGDDRHKFYQLCDDTLGEASAG
jgi:hypothetical protein